MTFHSVNDVTRRQFMRQASGAVMATTMAPLVGAPAAIGNDAGPLRVGLIGCGGRGTGAAVQALTADAGAVLVAMADMFEDRVSSCRNALTQHFGENAASRIKVDSTRQYTGFDAGRQLIEGGVDVVLLCDYPHFRPAHLEAAVAAGCHVFCEKPMAVDAPGLRRAKAAAEAAKEKNLALVAGFCWRYGDAERATYDKIHGGAIGDIVAIHTTYLGSTLSKRPRRPEWSDMEFQLRNWWHFTWLSGDHIVEQACHAIDKIHWGMNGRLPLRCTTLGGRAARTGPESGDAFDHFAAVYEYDGGARCFHTCRQMDHCPSDNADYIYGSNGSCVINGWIPQHEIRDRAGKLTWSYDGPRRDMYQNEHDALFASIRAGQPINDGQRMCESTMMAIMARMAAYTGQTITWDQAWNSKEDFTPQTYEFGPLPTPALAVPGVRKFL